MNNQETGKEVLGVAVEMLSIVANKNISVEDFKKGLNEAKNKILDNIVTDELSDTEKSAVTTIILQVRDELLKSYYDQQSEM